MNKPKVLCPGEALIDFVATQNLALDKVTTFEKMAGGAPLNAAAVMNQFGVASYFMGSIANDPFGKFLVNTIEELGVDSSLVQASNLFTTFAYVSIDSDGERDFVFNRGSDQTLKVENTDNLGEFDAFHFSSATAFLGGELETSYLKLLDFATENNKLIIFDPNYRHDLFKDKVGKFIAVSEKFIRQSDIVKLSQEELVIITGTSDINQGINKVLELGCEYVIITLGSKGALLASTEKQRIIPSINVTQIDTTGAGDAFIGYLVSQVAKLDNYQFEDIAEIVKQANIVGALTTTKIGAISAIPTEDEINLHIKQ